MTAIIAELPRLIVGRTFSFWLNALPYQDFGAGMVTVAGQLPRMAKDIQAAIGRSRSARLSRLYAAGGGSRPEDRSYDGARGTVSMRSPSVKRRCRGNLSRCGITQRNSA